MNIDTLKSYYQSLPESFMPEEVKRIFCRIPSQWNHLMEMCMMDTLNQTRNIRIRGRIMGSHEHFSTKAVDKVFERMMESGVRFSIENQRLFLKDVGGDVEKTISWYTRELDREEEGL